MRWRFDECLGHKRRNKKRDKKAASLAIDGWLVFARRGLISRVQAVMAGYYQTPLGGGPHNTRFCNSLLRQDQLAKTRGAKLVGLAIVQDGNMALTLQQRIAAQRPLAPVLNAVERPCFRNGFWTRKRRIAINRTTQPERIGAQKVGHVGEIRSLSRWVDTNDNHSHLQLKVFIDRAFR
jgi:hypothetical protein